VFVEVAEALIGVLEFEVEASIFLHSLCILPFCTAISQALNKAFSKTQQKNKKKRKFKPLMFQNFNPPEKKKVELIGMKIDF
jgi:hypothetical protein